MKKSYRTTNSSTAMFILFGMIIAGVTFSTPAGEIIYGNGLLVTTSGRVVRGKISVLETGYAVELSSGTVTYPFSTIICEARSLQEAYRKQREAMTRPTTDQHVHLAKWAFEQKLFAEAERELHSALTLQPNNQTAKRLLKQFDNKKPKDSEFIDPHKKKTLDKILIDREFKQGQPLGGLTPELAKEFASAIEPLLINKCSNASCHGGSVTHDFRLQRKWNVRGNSRHITEKNLQAVLKQINIARPDLSPLTTKLDGKHGYRKRSVFTGARAKEQHRTLQNWTMRTGLYLQEIRKEEKTTFTQLVGDKDNTQPSSGKIQQAGFTSPQAVMLRPEPVSPKKPTLLEQTRKEQAHDPFNPEIFNRKIHKK